MNKHEYAWAGVYDRDWLAILADGKLESPAIDYIRSLVRKPEKLHTKNIFVCCFQSKNTRFHEFFHLFYFDYILRIEFEEIHLLN